MKPNERPCLSLFKAPHISKDGIVAVCCPDFKLSLQVGDIKKNRLNDIWFGKKATEYRLAHIKGEFQKTPRCKFCTGVSTLTDEEVKEFLKFHKKEHLYKDYLKRVNSQPSIMKTTQ